MKTSLKRKAQRGHTATNRVRKQEKSKDDNSYWTDIRYKMGTRKIIFILKNIFNNDNEPMISITRKIMKRNVKKVKRKIFKEIANYV